MFSSLSPRKFSKKNTYNFNTDTYLAHKTRKNHITQGFPIKNKHRIYDTASYHNYGAYLNYNAIFDTGCRRLQSCIKIQPKMVMQPTGGFYKNDLLIADCLKIFYRCAIIKRCMLSFVQFNFSNLW